MIRLTIIETADLIKRPYHWVYDKAKKLGIDSVKILDIDQIYEIFKISCLSRGYENFDYKAVAENEYEKLVNVVRPISRLKDERKLTPEIFYEILFAEKVIKPHIAMFNIIAYLSREMQVNDTYVDKYRIKKYLFEKLNRKLRMENLSVERFYDIKYEGLTDVQVEAYEVIDQRIRSDFGSC
jgi:hypothetical protein